MRLYAARMGAFTGVERRLSSGGTATPGAPQFRPGRLQPPARPDKATSTQHWIDGSAAQARRRSKPNDPISRPIRKSLGPMSRTSARNSGSGSSMSARQRSRSTERAGRHVQPIFRAPAHRQRLGGGRPTGLVRWVCKIICSSRNSLIQNRQIIVSEKFFSTQRETILCLEIIYRSDLF